MKELTKDIIASFSKIESKLSSAEFKTADFEHVSIYIIVDARFTTILTRTLLYKDSKKLSNTSHLLRKEDVLCYSFVVSRHYLI